MFVFLVASLMRIYFLPKNTKCHDSKSRSNLTMTAVSFLTSPYTSFPFKLPCKRNKIQPACTSILSNRKQQKKVTDIIAEIYPILFWSKKLLYCVGEPIHITPSVLTISSVEKVKGEYLMDASPVCIWIRGWYCERFDIAKEVLWNRFLSAICLWLFV